MSKGKFTKGKWNLHVREMTDTCGKTFRQCFIEKNGVVLAQFANFGEEDEANARLIAAAPEMHKLLRRIESYFKNRHIYGPGVEESVSKKLMIRIERVMKKADGKICER